MVRTVCGQCLWHFRGVEDSGENCVRSVFVVLVVQLVVLSFAPLQAQVSCLNKRNRESEYSAIMLGRSAFLFLALANLSLSEVGAVQVRNKASKVELAMKFRRCGRCSQIL